MKIYGQQRLRFSARISKYTVGVLAALAAALLAGCGGGGGGGGSSSTNSGSTTTNYSFSGTLTVTSGSAGVPPYTAHFDSTTGPSNTVNLTSSTSGTFAISVPSTDITGNDTIYIVDSTGATVATSGVITNDTIGAANVAITIGPPPKPPLAIRL